MTHPSLTILHPSILQHIHTNFEIRTLADDCVFTEGPVWNEEGFYLFSDIPANCIYKITTETAKEVFLSQSGTPDPANPFLRPDQAGSNALAYDADGALLVCRHGSHDIARYVGGTLLPLINSFEGRPFNSPNDLILHPDGRIYFSDPPYGLKEGKLNPEKFQPLAGVYCRNEGDVQLLCDKYQYPNGVCLSPDHSILYICSNKPFESFISAYDMASNHFIKIIAEENSDGIECDPSGNIYLCNKDGIILLNPSGERLGVIALPTIPSNLCWGGQRRKDLFITAREHVYLIPELLK